MAVPTDVNAQTSFNGVEDTFARAAFTAGVNNIDILGTLKLAAANAVTAVKDFVFLSDNDFTEAEIAYLRPLFGIGGADVLHDKVKREIETGDFGIDARTEDLVFERMRERESRVMASAVDGANRAFSSGGFTQPTGAANAAVTALQAEARDKVISAGREQTVKHVDTYLAAKKLAFDTGVAINTYALEKFFKVLSIKIEQLKTDIQAQATIATAAMSGLNVNLGLSVSGSASVGGSESISESTDKSAGEIRKSQSWDMTKEKETRSHSEVHEFYTNET